MHKQHKGIVMNTARQIKTLTLEEVERIRDEEVERIRDKEAQAELGRTADLFGVQCVAICDRVGDVQIITDMNGLITVTRDISHLLTRMRNDLGKANLCKYVIYRDEHGVYDGVIVDNVFNYVGFYSINTTDRMTAICKAFGDSRGLN